MFLKEFEIRWSDLDPNRHLANSSYVNFMSHTRMALLSEIGFTHKELAQHQIGPVVFYEHIYYFKEVFPGKPIRVSLELQGISEDGMFFEFLHNFYDHAGKNFAQCEIMGAWIDLKTRKLIALPEEMQDHWDKVAKSKGFKILTKEDTRKYGRRPMDLM